MSIEVIKRESETLHPGPFGVMIADSDGVPVIRSEDSQLQRAVVLWLALKENRLGLRIWAWIRLWPVVKQ